MPASYAHYRFGKLLLPHLPAHVRQCVQRFRRMYDMGLQGPDFFFYLPFLKNAHALGAGFHRQSGREFFPVACKAAGSEAARAYLYGLLAHYCLDSTCHPYVNQLDAIGEARHVPLESEFERFLLVLDKEPAPRQFDVSRFMKLTRGEATAVAAFYPTASSATVIACLRFMARFTRLLSLPDRAWQKRLLQKADSNFRDKMVPAAENEELAVYIRELYDLYGQALDRYPQLLSQLLAHLKTGEALGEEFTPEFG